MCGAGPAIGVCYSLPEVSLFFRSVATAMAIQNHTKLKWVPYDDSVMLNVTYALLFWKGKPGHVEVHEGARADVNRTIDKYHADFVRIWLEVLFEKGPREAMEYVRKMEKLRDSSRRSVDEVWRDAGHLNDQVRGELNEGIKNLARIKLASQVGVAVIGAAGAIIVAGGATLMVGGATLTVGQSAAALTGLQLTNTLALSLAKSWETSDAAKAVAIDMGKAGGKAVANELGSRGAEALAQKAAQQIGHSEQVIRSAEGQIRKYSKALAEEGVKKARLRKARNIIQSSKKQIAEQTAEIGTATSKKVAAGILSKALPVVFAAWDIKDAFTEYQGTVKRAR